MKAIYLIGAPRSGTTWLQHLMGAHPRVATPQELDIFVDLVPAMREAWAKWLRDPEAWRRLRYKGLPAAVTEQRFNELVREFLEGVYREILQLKPSADVVLEKVPRYSFSGRDIQYFVPDAAFVHIIRDGRDVAASLLRAGRSWGRDWAPSSMADAATRWRDHVTAARSVRELTDRYVEIRYEELASARGPEALCRVLRACGVDVTEAECAEIHGRSENAILWGGEVQRRLGGSPEEPAGFIGAKTPGAWRSELNWYDRWAFDEVAGEVLMDLGYVDSRAWATADPRARFLGRPRYRAENLRVEWKWRWQQIRDATRRY